MSPATAEPLSAKFARLNAWVLEGAGVILAPGVLFLLVRVILDFAGRLHWTLELLLVLVLAALLALLLSGLRANKLEQLRLQHPLRVIVALFLFITLLAVTVFSALSVLLWRWQPESYSGVTQYTPGKFADFYFWQLLESLPGLKLMTTYNIPSPMTPHGAEAATLVLLFRAVIIVRLLAAARSWFRISGRTREENVAGVAA